MNVRLPNTPVVRRMRTVGLETITPSIDMNRKEPVMIKRMVIALAGLLALFAFAAAPASAAPTAASPDSSILVANQWTAYPQAGFAGTPTQVNHLATCTAIPSGNTFSGVNGADSTFNLQLFSSSACSLNVLVAYLPAGDSESWSVAATHYISI